MFVLVRWKSEENVEEDGDLGPHWRLTELGEAKVKEAVVSAVDI